MSGPLSTPPQPEGLTNPAEFVAALGRLRQWSGLTYRQLTAAAKTAGDVLPTSTIAGALGRTTLPREEFVAAFVRACGLGEAETARWVAHRKRLAAGMTLPADPRDEATGPDRPPGRPEHPGPAGRSGHAEPAAPAVPDDPAAAEDPAGPLRDAVRPETRVLRRFAVAGAGVVVLLLATGAVLPELRASLTGGGAKPSPAPAAATAGSDRTPSSAFPGAATAGSDRTPSSAATPGGGRMPRDGWYRMIPSHVAGADLCVGEGRERNKRTDRPLAVQRPCRDLVPDTYLRAAGGGAYEIQWHHPEEGVGCLTVDGALTGQDTLLAPENCSGAAHQRFLLTPSGPGFTLRPLHSGLCLGALYGEADVTPGAELAQKSCTGRPDQLFLFRPVPAPAWTRADHARRAHAS
ncbi:XRE family transcriptional regulator [Microbispora sp. H13382]|uniref:XRE family transcriptional regulator n=1 Tax=Microbispora sp. H13382 TaxID=2729112 RepID=UPI0016015AA5|nr:XRE family transcriptional regulator [Microbispora sp. H13382]